MTPALLKQSGRIKGPTKRRFDEVYRTGRRLKGDFFTLIICEGTGFIGIATSKKIGEKPPRNYQKRRVRSILQSFRRTRTHDLVIVAYQNSKQVDFATISNDLTQLINGAEIGWERK